MMETLIAILFVGFALFIAALSLDATHISKHTKD